MGSFFDNCFIELDKMSQSELQKRLDIFIWTDTVSLGIPRRRLGYSATTDAKVSVLTFICFDATLSMGTIYYA